MSSILKPSQLVHIGIEADLANNTCKMQVRETVDGFTLAMLLLTLCGQSIARMRQAAMMEIGKVKYDIQEQNNLKGGNDGKENNDSDKAGN